MAPSSQFREGSKMIGLLAVAASVTSGCPAERAHYALRGRTEIMAYFRAVESGDDWPSHLALAIHSSQTGQTTWWVPWQGGTDGQTNIASTTDVMSPEWRPPDPDDGPRPHGDRQFLTTDASYKINEVIPLRGQAAPAHMLIPDSGGSQDHIFPAKQFFDFVGCTSNGG